MCSGRCDRGMPDARRPSAGDARTSPGVGPRAGGQLRSGRHPRHRGRRERQGPQRCFLIRDHGCALNRRDPSKRNLLPKSLRLPSSLSPASGGRASFLLCVPCHLVFVMGPLLFILCRAARRVDHFNLSGRPGAPALPLSPPLSPPPKPEALGRTVLRLDLRGHGRSGRSRGRRSRSLASEASELREASDP